MVEQIGMTDTRIIEYRPAISPYQIKIDNPLTDKAAETVRKGRMGIEKILSGTDSRILAIVGPCSIHDYEMDLEYARKLADLNLSIKDQILIAMRVYTEKPRTNTGWKGFNYDPDLNGTDDINKGTKQTRKFLLEVSELGLATATEYLDPFSPQYTDDLMSWAAIGARTTESQTHREMASGLSMPVGFKNGTSGDIEVAINGILAARQGHSFRGINEFGAYQIVVTEGNPYGHLVLRGGGGKTNYDARSVEEAKIALEKAKLPSRLIIDMSHGNTVDKDGVKQYENQIVGFQDGIKQIRDGSTTVVGLMVESLINPDSQKIPPDLTGFDPTTLDWGVSVTDGCIDWKTTEELLNELHSALSGR